ncbi:MAG: hypothetical protein QOH70_3580 [Blastocatellia bacterium]|nr:hypothetical protein [Blastocatellia bacterium]
MRLANRVLLCALAIFVFSALTFAQTPRPENDPRNQSPSVGTGGPEGGPTGLFTIYDGSTLRKGEFTFSVAYSNYDRDPGNADITDWIASVNIGLNDHIELFFKTQAYRGIKVNNPQNLSSFYLPNTQGYFGTGLLGSGPAIILAPSGPNVGTIAGTAVFRPPFCPGCVPSTSPLFGYYNAGQPFVAYPYTGGAGPNFQMGPGAIGTLFGFPGFSAQLGPPSAVGNTFGHADIFPGVGSPVGSILPGIVLATQQLPCTALTGNCRPPGSPGSLTPIIVPTSYTTAPSYLPDAPFVSRLYGESSFGNFVGGAKIRLTGPRNPFGFGFIPFYRWYPDKADSAQGFNQLQRGASPGANLGDFGLVMFADGRLSKSVNLSANLGYILNSNPKSGNSTLLDRPDELIAGIGVDFPINKYVQPIAEFRSTQYVGGHTPNAFPNNPVEFLVGIKLYPARWWGFGAWYRRALNDQRQGNFNPADSSTSVQQTTNVNVPGRGIVVVPGTSFVATSAGFPLGFQPSSDPYGFGFQFFAGHRNKREPSILPNQPPTASLAASVTTITLPCPPDTHSSSGSCGVAANTTVGLTTTASDPDGDTLLYTYTVTGGRITGEGTGVSWDLSGVGPGTYTASVEVDDGCGCVTASSTTVTVANCSDCIPNLVCPTVNVTCPSEVEDGAPVTYTATVNGGTPAVSPTYNWTVSAGTISSGQGTSSITVDTKGTGGQTITATVELGGIDPTCGRTASCSTPVKGQPPVARKFDEYGNIRFNDEKARLDNFAIQLQNEPAAQGYIIGYGSCDAEGQTRANRAKDYLVNTRGIDAGRLVVVDGGCMPELKVELWVVPSGATPPAASTDGAVSPCPDCKKKPSRRRGGSRRRGEE